MTEINRGGGDGGRIILKDLPTEALTEVLAPLGASPRLARQIQAAVLRYDRWLEVGPGISPTVLARVRAQAVLPRLEVVDKQVSPSDGFARYAFRGDGAGVFEAVRIPLLHRPGDEKYIVCVSSQVGCAMGCVFCATGRLGFVRNLATWEIVDQVMRIRADSPHPVRGVVFMGMGEPLLNYDAVMRAARLFADPCGFAIDGRGISISTVGVAPAIRRFAAERPRFRLILSLSSADPAQRLALLPAEATWPTAELIAALRELHAATGRRVTVAWTMIAGVNTSEEAARRLGELTRDLPIKIDLIDVNDPSGRFRPPDEAELSVFRDALRRHVGAPVARRYSGGRDIDAACGLLAGRLQNVPPQ